jgi:hypothetical protein
MEQPRRSRKRSPFPRRLPEITIRPSRAKPFAVACRELLWWFAVPEAGDRTLWAVYDPPDWRITSFTDMRVTRPAVVDAIEGVEIEVTDVGFVEDSESPIRTIYGRLTPKTAQYLAVVSSDGGTVRLRTFLEEGFDKDWGELPRLFADRGRFVLQPDGTFRRTRGRPEAIGAGVFRVHVADNRFTCLRVFHLDGALKDPHATLIEAYLTRAGRTVLQRHYCQESRRKGHVSEARPPIVIDGVRFLPWYDCLSHIACGIKP